MEQIPAAAPAGRRALVMLAAGCAAGGLAAWAGAGLTVQVLATAAVTIIGWAWLWRRSPWRQASGDSTADASMLLDVGERLEVDAWGEDRRAQVRYRGAAWTVELDPQEPASSAVPGRFVIRRIRAVLVCSLLLGEWPVA